MEWACTSNDIGSVPHFRRPSSQKCFRTKKLPRTYPYRGTGSGSLSFASTPNLLELVPYMDAHSLNRLDRWCNAFSLFLDRVACVVVVVVVVVRTGS